MILPAKKSEKYISRFDFYLIVRVKPEILFINIDDCFTQAYPARNDYLYGRVLLRLRSSCHRWDIGSGIKNNVHTTYIHGL